jgi:hypothetical protein
MLTVGLNIGHGDFTTPDEHDAAWWAHRERLMTGWPLFSRPAGFWTVEARYEPNCKASNYESERDALVRLELLTPAEQAIIAREKLEKLLPEKEVETDAKRK